MTWNYRVFRDTFEDESTVLTIREVYYHEDGSLRAYSGPIEPFGEDRDELRFMLEKMTYAMYEPVLSAEDFKGGSK